MITIADYIKNLKQELAQAAKQGSEEKPRLKVETIVLEATVSTTGKTDASGKVNFYIYEGKIGGHEEATETQKITIQFTLLDPDIHLGN